MGGGPKADAFAKYLNSTENLLLPSIVFYEVYKKLYRERTSTLAQAFVSHAYSFGDRLIPLDVPISIWAAHVSLENKLPMADAIIYATAQHHSAQLITSDAHFANLPGVTLL
jgi:predicted nucleic acid-binding protein